ncbi:hypothetical protein L2E82_19673 [Cichorium intybus]|uniref:Uncharacterized protein n=1 Tax=Cichorium intybus TaxID=13427 RepID=A0ACB9FDX8_CICIN|nr:hypothetical protein L2E82_19673 [Cichorium intybus]
MKETFVYDFLGKNDSRDQKGSCRAPSFNLIGESLITLVTGKDSSSSEVPSAAGSSSFVLYTLCYNFYP